MLRFFLSNRYLVLRQALLERLATPPASPFVADEIIVPSAALKRDVELAIAGRYGVCANVRFSFLAQWLWRQIARVIQLGEVSPFTADVLAWRVFQILGERKFVERHPPLERYLRDGDPLLRFDLASRTAALIEQYVTYRPEWLSAWAEGRLVKLPEVEAGGADSQRWQAALWQRIAADLGAGGQHPSVAFFGRIEAMGADAPRRAGLPATAHVFALPTLAPLHLDLLRRFSRWIDIDVYLVNPSREYWFDIVAPRRLSWLAAHGGLDHHESGNRLLAAWGQQSRQAIEMIFDAEDDAAEEHSEFVEADGRHLLARVQNALLDLQELPARSLSVIDADRSIEVHVCHSLTRELEVLQDRLLGLFAGKGPPRPADVIVVTPDLEAAAPLINAVFGTAPAHRRIPYAITGRPASHDNAAARALLALLALAASRVTATGVFELLQQDIVARRFDIGAMERDAIHGWMRAAGVRWGLDATHRAQLDLPASGDYSFGDGLERLLLGYALPDAASVFQGRLPAGGAEGSGALALGGLHAFIREVDWLHRILVQPKSAEGWRAALSDALARFLAPQGDEVDDLRGVEAAIAALADNIAQGGATQAIAATVIQAALASVLDDPARGGVPTGAVTFSSMASLRGLPRRVVCVIGMNDGAYPSAAAPLEFDLIARAPRRGDRQRRLDERNVFLDLALAAQDCLHLSYTGYSVRDNSTLPPSVLVDELLDVLVPALAADNTPAANARARSRIVIEHPLQPFSRNYFAEDADPRLRSYNDEYCDALRKSAVAAIAPVAVLPATLADSQVPMDADSAANDDYETSDDVDEPGEAQSPFFPAPLAASGPEWRSVALPDLVRFFGNPSRYLLQERLGIALPRRPRELDDDEPFVPDFDGRVALAERLLPLFDAARPAGEILALARAGREYPPGTLGTQALERELARLDTFARALASDTAERLLRATLGSIDCTLDDEPWRLDIEFTDLRATGLVRHRYADAQASDYLAGWIEHLALNALRPAGVAPRTTWHSRDGRYVLLPLAGAAEAEELLRSLLRRYREGLVRPLHFYPKAAWAYRSKGNKLGEARKKWRGSPAFGGEKDDPACRLALRGDADALDAAFMALADEVFAPLLACLDDPRIAR